jgi:hypothetical protein
MASTARRIATFIGRGDDLLEIRRNHFPYNRNAECFEQLFGLGFIDTLLDFFLYISQQRQVIHLASFFGWLADAIVVGYIQHDPTGNHKELNHILVTDNRSSIMER